MSGRRNYLYLDLGFYAPCNLKCTYCRNEIVKDNRSFSFSMLVDQIEAFLSRYRAAVVKFSGYGEITQWAHFEEALDFLSSRFPMVQVISNGTFPEKKAHALLSYANVSPNLTIDGHTVSMNSHRVGTKHRLHERMFENLQLLTDSGRKVEINCVLHDRNVGEVDAYLEYMQDHFGGKVMIFPYPAKSFDRARGVGNSLHTTTARLAESIDQLWERYANVLPPKSYGLSLRKFIVDGRRRNACHVHWANLGSGAGNERLHCPNYGEDLSYGPMVDVLTSQADQIEALEHKHLQAGYVGPGCSGCFNHFNVINLYLDGVMSLDDLLTLPSLAAPAIGEIAHDLKEEFKRGRGMSMLPLEAHSSSLSM